MFLHLSVSHSVHSVGEDVCPSVCWDAQPQAETPWANTPSWADIPPPGQTPPQQTPPLGSLGSPHVHWPSRYMCTHPLAWCCPVFSHRDQPWAATCVLTLQVHVHSPSNIGTHPPAWCCPVVSHRNQPGPPYGYSPSRYMCTHPPIWVLTLQPDVALSFLTEISPGSLHVYSPYSLMLPCSFSQRSALGPHMCTHPPGTCALTLQYGYSPSSLMLPCSFSQGSAQAPIWVLTLQPDVAM